MFTVVMMAALTTGIDMPDKGGRRGGGCCGCYGGGGMGMGYGGGMGMGMGGCYGMGMGYGGGMGMGSGGMRMGYGGGSGGMGMGYGGGYGYGGYTMGAYSPNLGGYANSPMMSSWGSGTPLASGGAYLNSGTTRSYFGNPAASNEATIVVHLPADASLSIDGQQTQQRSDTRIFTSPPLEPGKTFTYTLRAERDRDGHLIRDTKTVEIRAGQRSEVTLNFGNANRDEEGSGRRGPVDEAPPPAELRRPPSP